MPSALSVVTETLPKSQVGMTIEVPAEVVDATYDRVLNRLASRAKIEGFRPGRAPRALVEARIGAAVLREEVVETMVPEVVRQALDDKSIDPIDNPANASYAGWPERFYIIDESGMIVFKGRPGPFGYHPEEVEDWLARRFPS